jgi:hypothetical protein
LQFRFLCFSESFSLPLAPQTVETSLLGGRQAGVFLDARQQGRLLVCRRTILLLPLGELPLELAQLGRRELLKRGNEVFDGKLNEHLHGRHRAFLFCPITLCSARGGVKGGEYQFAHDLLNSLLNEGISC